MKRLLLALLPLTAYGQVFTADQDGLAPASTTADQRCLYADATYGPCTDGTAISHTELQDKGEDSHLTVDAHIDATDIHAPLTDTDHNFIQNRGTTTHPDLDTHVADPNIHALPSEISHSELLGIGTDSHVILDAHLDATDIHTTPSLTDHNNLQNSGDSAHSTIDTHLINSSTHFTDAPADGTNYNRNNNTWQPAETMIYEGHTSDATSDLEADHVAGWNEWANRTIHTRASNEIVYWTWPSTAGSTWQIVDNTLAPPWNTPANQFIPIGGDPTAWGQITGTISAQTDLQNQLDLKANQSALDAHTSDTANPHAVAYDQLGNVPLDFPPSSHTHTESEVTDLDKYTQVEVDNKDSTLQTNIDAKIGATDVFSTAGPGTTNPPTQPDVDNSYMLSAGNVWIPPVLVNNTAVPLTDFVDSENTTWSINAPQVSLTLDPPVRAYGWSTNTGTSVALTAGVWAEITTGTWQPSGLVNLTPVAGNEQRIRITAPGLDATDVMRGTFVLSATIALDENNVSFALTAGVNGTAVAEAGIFANNPATQAVGIEVPFSLTFPVSTAADQTELSIMVSRSTTGTMTLSNISMGFSLIEVNQ